MKEKEVKGVKPKTRFNHVSSLDYCLYAYNKTLSTVDSNYVKPSRDRQNWFTVNGTHYNRSEFTCNSMGIRIQGTLKIVHNNRKFTITGFTESNVINLRTNFTEASESNQSNIIKQHFHPFIS